MKDLEKWNIGMMEEWDNGFETIGDFPVFPLSIIKEIVELFMIKPVIIP
jgi:hypothetical protein